MLSSLVKSSLLCILFFSLSPSSAEPVSTASVEAAKSLTGNTLEMSKNNNLIESKYSRSLRQETENWKKIFIEEHEDDEEALEQTNLPVDEKDLISPEDYFLHQEAVPFVEADSWEEAEDLIEEAMSSDEAPTAAPAAYSSVTPVRGISRRYGPCVLYPRPVWLRTSTNHKDIGTKPLTVCNGGRTVVSKIVHETRMHYKWFLWMRGAGPWVKSSNTNQARMEQKNVRYKCRGSKQTWWSSETRAKVTYKGKTYRSVVTSAMSRKKCGAR